jgi:hypothetical protein
MATFEASVGKLSMTLSEGSKLQAYRHYAISFRLKNGFQGTNLEDIRIAAFLTRESKCMGPREGEMCTGETMTQRTVVKICEPGFTLKKIGQTFSWPGCDGAINNIVVTCP